MPSPIVVRRDHNSAKGSNPGRIDMTSNRISRASGWKQRKCIACPRWRYSTSNGGTAIHSACRSLKPLRNRSRFAESARIKRSVSRLNSAAPYNTHAWPPISRAWTRRAAIVERTLCIRLGIKGTSDLQVVCPQLTALLPPFERGEPIPIRPLASNDVFQLDHVHLITLLPPIHKPGFQQSQKSVSIRVHSW